MIIFLLTCFLPYILLMLWFDSIEQFYRRQDNRLNDSISVKFVCKWFRYFRQGNSNNHLANCPVINFSKDSSSTPKTTSRSDFHLSFRPGIWHMLVAWPRDHAPKDPWQISIWFLVLNSNPLRNLWLGNLLGGCGYFPAYLFIRFILWGWIIDRTWIRTQEYYFGASMV